MTMSPDPNPFPSDSKPRQSIPDEDMIMLESLIASPVFGALKRVLAIYKAEALSVLETTSDTHKVFQTQGRLIGIRSVENVGLLVQDWKNRQKIHEDRNAEKAKRDRRLKAQDPRPPVR